MNGPTKNRIALKGQSRSKFCAEPIRRNSKTRCARLAGHKGSHRRTTSTRTAPAVVEAPKVEVKQVPEVEPKARIGVSGVVGQHKTAKTGKGAHASSKPSARLA